MCVEGRREAKVVPVVEEEVPENGWEDFLFLVWVIWTIFMDKLFTLLWFLVLRFRRLWLLLVYLWFLLYYKYTLMRIFRRLLLLLVYSDSSFIVIAYSVISMHAILLRFWFYKSCLYYWFILLVGFSCRSLLLEAPWFWFIFPSLVLIEYALV